MRHTAIRIVTAAVAVVLLCGNGEAAALRFPVGNAQGGGPFVLSQSFQDVPFIFQGKHYQGHLGEDWAVEVGTQVFSIWPGRVVFSQDAKGEWGNVIIVRHDSIVAGRSIYSLYGHLSERFVAEGDDVVDVTTPIGLSGEKGSGAHLHFEIKDYVGLPLIPGPGYTMTPAQNVDQLDFLGVTYFRPTTFLLNTVPVPSGPPAGSVEPLPMLTGIHGIAIENGAQTALVAEQSGELSRIDLATGSVTLIAQVTAVGTSVPTSIGAPVILPGGKEALVITAPQSGGNASGLALINLETRDITTILANGLDRAAAMAVEPGGRSVIVTRSEGGLYRVNLDTRMISVISGVGGLGLALELNGTTALLATGIFGGGFSAGCDVVRVDLGTGSFQLVSTISCATRPTGIAIEPGGATAIVVTSARFAGDSSQIFRVDLSSGFASPISGCPLCSGPAIAIDSTGTTLFTAHANQSVIRLDRSNGLQTIVARADTPWGLAISPDGATAFTVSPHSFLSGRLSAIHLAAGRVDWIAFTDSIQGGVALDRAGTTAFLTTTGRFSGAGLLKVNLTSGVVSPVASVSGLGLALEGDGNSVLVAARDGRSLLRVNLVSGAVGLITDQLSNPVAVAIEREGLSALVPEGGINGSLARVNLQTGAVARIATGLGPSWVGTDPPPGIALEPGGASVLVAGPDGLQRVDLTTGTMTKIVSSFCGFLSGTPGPSGVFIEAGAETALVSHNVCGILRVRVR